MTITITTHSPVTGQEYRLADARGVEWFCGYGADGAGYGYLTFRLNRKTGQDYQDIGHGYTIHITKGPWKTLFHGQITKVAEHGGSEEGEYLTVWALGWVHLLGADAYNRVYCDTRLSAWITYEEPVGNFRPDLFEWSSEESSVRIMPRTNAEYVGTEYTALTYYFNFGETLRRIAFDYDVSIPSEWAGLGGALRLELMAGGDDGDVLWSLDSDGSGSVDVAIDAGYTQLELRLYFLTLGQHTRTQEDVYGQISSVRVYSVFVPTLDAAVIAKDLVAFLYRSGYGLSDNTAMISDTGIPLEPSVFVDDHSPFDIMAWCCQFGNSDGRPVAFGVAFDDTKRLFLEPWNLSSIRYVVNAKRMTSVERSGDWGESAQKVYGVVNLEDGGVVRTSDLVSTSMITKLGGYYRREPIQLDGVGNLAELSYLVQLRLSERKHPVASGSYTVKGSVQTPGGREVPVEEIVPGGLVQIQEWRAREANLDINDYRDNTTTFMLVGVHVMLDSQEVELIPSESSDAFARAMAIIQELRR